MLKERALLAMTTGSSITLEGLHLDLVEIHKVVGGWIYVFISSYTTNGKAKDISTTFVPDHPSNKDEEYMAIHNGKIKIKQVYFTIDEVMDYFRTNDTVVRKWIKESLISTRKMPGCEKYLFHIKDIREFEDKHVRKVSPKGERL